MAVSGVFSLVGECFCGFGGFDCFPLPISGLLRLLADFGILSLFSCLFGFGIWCFDIRICTFCDFDVCSGSLCLG